MNFHFMPSSNFQARRKPKLFINAINVNDKLKAQGSLLFNYVSFSEQTEDLSERGQETLRSTEEAG